MSSRTKNLFFSKRLFFTGTFLGIFCFVTSTQPEVNTTLGKIKGHFRITAKNVTYEAYEGIPYAEPPIKDNRFLPPKPISPWKDVLLADKLKDKCWSLYRGDKVSSKYHGNEDCLYLNLYVPKNKPSQLRPVIIFIHGGAFQLSGITNYEQNNFMDKDVIFVTINYRLGLLGFLSTEDDVVSGNMGLKDQAMAIKWVKDHIKSFGGDPDRVTLVGFSAGGASIHYHYLSPMTKGLFHSGLSLSGTALMPWAQTKNSREKAFKLGRLMNCSISNVNEMIECLRSKSARSLLEAQGKFMAWRETDFTPFGPVVEKSSKDAFIDRAPIEIINSGDAQKLPWITSIVQEEGLFPIAEIASNATILEELNQNWKSVASYLLQYQHTIPKSNHNEVARKVRKYYFGNEPIDKKNLFTLTHLVGDRLFGTDAIKAAKLQAIANPSLVWFYYYTYRPVMSFSEVLSGGSKENFGTSHGDDVSLVFRELSGSEKEKNDLKMQKKLIDLWISVARDGRPNLEPSWRSLSNGSDFEYLKISGPENIKMVTNNKLSNNQFWDSLNFNENVLN